MLLLIAADFEQTTRHAQMLITLLSDIVLPGNSMKCLVANVSNLLGVESLTRSLRNFSLEVVFGTSKIEELISMLAVNRRNISFRN